MKSDHAAHSTLILQPSSLSPHSSSFNLHRFFEKFDVFADAPGTVATMRELVLNLAVTGKLSENTDAWTELPLGEVSRLRRGYDLPKQDRKQGSVPIFAANGTVGFHEIHMVKGPGVVTGRSGSIGKVHFINEDFWPLNTALYVEDFFGNYPQFISLLLRSLHLDRFSTSTAVPTLNRNVVHKEIVKVPPLAEQKRIVAKVDALMALCDRLEAQQQERETRHAALARASLARFADAPTPANLNFLFHSSFSIQPSDLRKSILTLAVQGKLVPQDPNDEPAPRLETDVSFEIPVSWEWKALGAVGLCRTGKTPPTGDTTNYGPGFPFIGPGQITPNGAVILGEKTVTLSGLANSTEARPFDILMVCIGGSIGKAALCRETLGFNQQINSIRLTSDAPEFVYLVLTSRYFQEQVLAKATGSATPIINKGKWEQIPIPLPPLAEQRRIVAKVEQLMALVDELETQLAASRTTAASLLEALVAELTAA